MSVSYFEYKTIGERIEENVILIESGQIRIGDIVYCSKICDDVIILEFPKEDVFEQYHRDMKESKNVDLTVFSGSILVKTKSNESIYVPIGTISKISNGDYSCEINVKGKNRNARNKAEFLERTLRGDGFRVMVSKEKKGYILLLFGDSQESVSDYKESLLGWLGSGGLAW